MKSELSCSSAVGFLSSTSPQHYLPSVDYAALPLPIAAVPLLRRSFLFLLFSMTLLKKSLEFLVEVVWCVAGLAVDVGSDRVS